MNISQNELALFFDAARNTDDISLESFMSNLGVSFNSHADFLQFKTNMNDSPVPTPINEYHFPQAKIPEFVGKDSQTEQTIIIDESLLFATMFDDSQIINTFIRHIEDIPKENTINIIIDIATDYIDYQTVEAATFILNTIRRCKATKIFNFGSCVGFTELMIATCCDGIYIGEFAAVSIVRKIDISRLPKFMIPVFRQFIRYTFNYWVSKGLFTAEEIQEFNESEADGSISLLSEEIKQRLV